jgi:hypothetical protein
MTRLTRSLIAATILAGGIAFSPRPVHAHGHIGFHPAIVIGGWFGRPFYGYPYCGFSPYWSPCFDAHGPYVAGGPYGPSASNTLQLGMAAASGIGAVDLNVKPGAAEVWIDGRFVAEARDLDGSPGVLWLKDGPHRLVIYESGYRSFDEEVSVRPGQKLDLKVRLEKGASQPPGTGPDANPAQAH